MLMNTHVWLTFHGSAFSVCPGGLEAPCGHRGKCEDGFKGSGRCFCNTTFLGMACEHCAPGHYGPECKGMPLFSTTMRTNVFLLQLSANQFMGHEWDSNGKMCCMFPCPVQECSQKGKNMSGCMWGSCPPAASLWCFIWKNGIFY